MNRVVVTGMAGLTPVGNTWEEVEASLRAKKNGVTRVDEWDRYPNINTRLGAKVRPFELPDYYPRKKVRSMGAVAKVAVRATELALQQAGLIDDPCLTDGSTGISYGSSMGSTEAMGRFNDFVRHDGPMRGINATTCIQMLSHTCAMNLGLFFEVKGRVVPTCSACTSASQGIGLAFEAIRSGSQKVMISGGAEELCISKVALFDVLYATSSHNDRPDCTPRPFDADRDGMVIGEGGGTLILEDMDHARARGAKIYAELVGFGYNANGNHVTAPDHVCMEQAMRISLEQAGLTPDAIGYVNAHGTATPLGDVAESIATHAVFGENIPISSLKSYTGHTLGACGAIEAWAVIEMMNREWYAPTMNLDRIDPECRPLDYLTEGRSMSHEYVMTNNYAFGGINTSIIFKRIDL